MRENPGHTAKRACHQQQEENSPAVSLDELVAPAKAFQRALVFDDYSRCNQGPANGKEETGHNRQECHDPKEPETQRYLRQYGNWKQ